MNEKEFCMAIEEILADETGTPRGKAFESLVDSLSCLKDCGISVLSYLEEIAMEPRLISYLVRRKEGCENDDGTRYAMLVSVCHREHLFWVIDEFDDPYLYEYALAEDWDGVCAAYKLKPVMCENKCGDACCKECRTTVEAEPVGITLTEETALAVCLRTGDEDGRVWNEIPEPKIYKNKCKRS